LKNFNSILDALIPLVPVYKKEDVDGYFDCVIRLHNKLCSKPEHGQHRFKRSSLANMYRKNPALALKFIMVLESAGYFESFTIRVKKKTIAYCIPTNKLYELYNSAEPPDKFAVFPVDGVIYDEVRRGKEQDTNSFAMSSLAQPYFTINKFIYDILEEFPPCTPKDPQYLAHSRAKQYASQYLGREFRFPWFRDSRGRGYIKSTMGFSPQGSDTEKALVIPARTEVVTGAGLLALIEAALGYAEVELTKDHIVEIAKDPKKYRDEWKDFDKPFSFMAMADLLRQAVEFPEKPIAAYIPKDGRCSGLQHWTALSKTNAISARLGMEPEEAPDGLDMYEYVAKHWETNLPEDMKYLATRKSCKVSVMTFPYSATRTTSMDAVRDLFMAPTQWVDGGWKTTGEGLTYSECAKLGSLLFDCVNEVLSPFVAGRNWLVDSVTTIMNTTGESEVEWTTPDGFKAMQDAYKYKRKRVSAVYQGRRYRATTLVPQLGINGQKIPDLVSARNKIAPNVIHSLDATHLRMCATALRLLDIDGIWIHDSFAVHVNHSELLYKIIVEQFIALYKDDYLLTLKAEWESLYSVQLEEPPIEGSWDVETLKNCPRFFE